MLYQGRQADPRENPAAWHVWADEIEIQIDRSTGTRLDPDTADEATCEDPEATEWATEWRITHWIRRDALEPLGYTTLPEPCTETNPEDAHKKQESERAERRRVQLLNAAGLAETDVRRAFLRTLAARRTSPDGTDSWVLTMLVSHRDLLTDYRSGQILSEVLPVGLDLTDRERTTTPAKSRLLILVFVLCALEARLIAAGKSWWRPARYWGAGGFAPLSHEYLTFLSGAGYVLGPVERIVTGEHTVDEAEAAVTVASARTADRVETGSEDSR